MAQWYALRVRSHFERAVALAARLKGFEEFLPVCQNRRKWSDRSKPVEAPLFPGYVFCRLDVRDRFPLLTIPGVLHVVGVGKVPLPIDDAEIALIQNATRSRLPLEPWPFQEFGQRVKVENGPLVGIQGFLIHAEEQYRVVVNLPVLRRAVAVEIELSWVQALEGSRPQPEAQVKGSL